MNEIFVFMKRISQFRGQFLYHLFLKITTGVEDVVVCSPFVSMEGTKHLIDNFHKFNMTYDFKKMLFYYVENYNERSCKEQHMKLLQELIKGRETYLLTHL